MTRALQEAFRKGAATGEFLLPYCQACEHRWLPPNATCPRCRSAKIEMRPASGRGEVVAVCQFHRAYFADPDLPLPYTVLLLRLEEGPLCYGNPVELSTQPPVGTKVCATFVATSSGGFLPRFAPRRERS
jgi:uncharacterized protein